MNDLVGKTIKNVNTKVADNIVVLNFTDGTSVVIDTEPNSFGEKTCLYKMTILI